MKYKIEVTEEQLHIIINCVERVSKFNMGHLDSITDDVNFFTDNVTSKRLLVDNALEQVKMLIFPKLRRNESYSIGIRDDDKLSRIRQKQYEIYSELKLLFNVINKREDYFSGITVKFTDDNFPLIKLKKNK